MNQLREIWRWWRGAHPSLRDQIRERERIDAIAEQLDEGDG